MLQERLHPRTDLNQSYQPDKNIATAASPGLLIPSSQARRTPLTVQLLSVLLSSSFTAKLSRKTSWRCSSHSLFSAALTHSRWGGTCTTTYNTPVTQTGVPNSIKKKRKKNIKENLTQLHCVVLLYPLHRTASAQCHHTSRGKQR